MRSVSEHSRYWAIAALFAAVMLISVVAVAQITKTARIELSEDGSRTPVGTEVYITPDGEGRLSDQIVASRHENNLRGKRQDSEVINLGFAPPPVWMVFSVTNNSAQEEWVLDFGTLSMGRMGLVHKLMVKNHTRDEVYVRTM